jgi:glycosyltransferase involved in cell wall biosynthesis
MKYPNILFFRDESYGAIDTFLSANEEKLNCTLNPTSDPNEVLKLFDSNYHLIVTYGKSETEYYGRMGYLVNRMRLRWLHFYENIKDLDAFNRGVNFCYIHNCLLPHSITRPIFSIFTTCYNSYAKFHRPYNSLKAQSLQDWEWVVIDDSPDDKHFEFLRTLAKNDSRIRLYRRSENSGNIGNVKNEAASLCRGKYILELDHDDEILQDCLSDAEKVFEKDPEVGFVYMDTAHLYENGNTHSYGDHFGLGYAGYYCQKYNGTWVNVISTPNINNYTLSHIVGVPNHPRIWRRTTLHELGNYSEFLPICDDQELLLRTAVKTKMARVHKLAYIQYMNDGWNNFSLIRNSEINRLGPQFIVPQAYADYKIDDAMRKRNGFEEPTPNWWALPMWKRENFTNKYCNSLINLNHKKQYCILGYKCLMECIESIRELYANPENDFLVLENGMTKEDLCRILDSLKLSRMRCYAMSDCTWDQLRAYFFLIYKSTEDHEVWTSSESACSTLHTSVTVPVIDLEEQVQEQIVETTLPLQSELPVQV